MTRKSGLQEAEQHQQWDGLTSLEGIYPVVI